MRLSLHTWFTGLGLINGFHLQQRCTTTRRLAPVSAASDVASPEAAEKICILGGGFGGLYTALRLSQLPWGGKTKPDITLVDRRDKFTFLPLLYELACGTAQLSEVTAPFPELLRGSGVHFVQGDVSDIDLVSRIVTVTPSADDRSAGSSPAQPSELSFDKTVVALGAEPLLAPIPGAKEHAFPFYSVEDAYRLRAELRRLRSSERADIRVVLVGASYGGVELACNLVDALTIKGRRPSITIVDRNAAPLRGAASSNREAALKRLKAAGVELICPASVLEVAESCITVQRDGSSEPMTLPSDLTMWTAGSRPSEAISALPLAKDDRGRLLVDPRLCVPGTAGAVYALGDVACIEDAETLPATAQAALQQSDYVAWNIWAAKRGRDPLDFKYVDLGQLLTLGPRDGALSTLGGRVNLSGPAAGLARRLLYAARMPTNGQRVRAAVGLATNVVTDVAQLVLGGGAGRTRRKK